VDAHVQLRERHDRKTAHTTHVDALAVGRDHLRVDEAADVAVREHHHAHAAHERRRCGS
jgi:hypothetical protein